MQHLSPCCRYIAQQKQHEYDLLALQFGTLQETAATWKEYAESLQEQYNKQTIEYEQEIDRLSGNMKAMEAKYQTLKSDYNSMKREYEQIVPPNPLNPKSHQDRDSPGWRVEGRILAAIVNLLFGAKDYYYYYQDVVNLQIFCHKIGTKVRDFQTVVTAMMFM